jgi:hypothetical protein
MKERTRIFERPSQLRLIEDYAIKKKPPKIAMTLIMATLYLVVSVSGQPLAN